jgi:hypothetical protein
MTQFRLLPILFGLFCGLLTTPVQAQWTSEELALLQASEPMPPEPAAGSWEFELVLYAWVPGVEGEVSARGRTTSVSQTVAESFESLREHLKLAASAHLEARNGPLVLFGDIMYAALEDDDIRSRVIGPGEVTFRHAFGELGAAFSIVDEPFGENGKQRFRVEPLVGVRGYYMNLELDFPAARIDASRSKSWVDGFVGVRTSVDVTEEICLFARLDVGKGGSDRAWNLLLGGKLRVFDGGAIYAGYRWLDIDYDEGGTDFEFDARLAGPFVGFGVSF